jgi:hypothetical protein
MSWNAMNLALIGERPPIQPTIGGLVYPERRHLFSGPPESAKTRAVLALALEEIAPAERSRGRTGLVRIVTHKDRFGFLARPRAAELELRSDPDTFAVSWAFRPATNGTEERGRRRLAAHRSHGSRTRLPRRESRTDLENGPGAGGEGPKRVREAGNRLPDPRRAREVRGEEDRSGNGPGTVPVASEGTVPVPLSTGGNSFRNGHDRRLA